MNKKISSAVVLFLLIVLGIASLYFVNGFTEPTIKENAFLAEEVNLKKLLPDVDQSAYTQVEVKDSNTIEKIFKVDGVGYVFKMNVSGFKDGSTFMVALDDKAEIAAVYVISNSDTEGIGDRVLNEDFAGDMVGSIAGKDKLDTISGATMSSKPIVQAIEEAATYLAGNLE